jgi:ribonuclease VapC
VIVDSSAIIAIVQQEPDAAILFKAFTIAESASMSIVSLVETAIVIDSKHDPVFSNELDRFLEGVKMRFVAVDEKQARIARQAYRDFGKGSGHLARLNFGDCFAYAAAKALNEPLLYKGTDFGQTDVRSALP